MYTNPNYQKACQSTIHDEVPKHIIQDRHVDEWIDAAGNYYAMHNVGERVFLTFDHFTEMFSSGRWHIFREGGLPEPYPNIEKEGVLHKLALTPLGYGVQKDEEFEVFGFSYDNRIHAMRRFVELTGHDIPEARVR